MAAALAVVAACAHHARAPIPLPTRVDFAAVTWNMHAGKGDLRALVEDLTSGRLAGAPIHEYILLLQEAIHDGPHDVETFARENHLHAVFSPVRRTRAGVSGNALLATQPLSEPRAIDLPRVRQPRAALIAQVHLAGVTLFVANAHLENRVTWLRGGLLSDRARARQVDALMQVIPATGPAIVGGDLNTWLGISEPAWRRLADRFPDTREPNEPTFRNRLTLDHLFFDLPGDRRAAEIISTNSYGSDHHPVVGLVISAPSGGRPVP